MGSSHGLASRTPKAQAPACLQPIQVLALNDSLGLFESIHNTNEYGARCMPAYTVIAVCPLS